MVHNSKLRGETIKKRDKLDLSRGRILPYDGWVDGCMDAWADGR